MSAVVDAVPLLVAVTVRTPPELVNVAKVSPPDCRLLPLTVKSAPDVLNPKVSEEIAVPERCTERLPPDQLPLPLLRAPNSVSVNDALELASSTTVLPTPAQDTLSPLRLVMAGVALGGLVSPPKLSILVLKKSVAVTRTSSTRIEPKLNVELAPVATV